MVIFIVVMDRVSDLWLALISGSVYIFAAALVYITIHVSYLPPHEPRACSCNVRAACFFVVVCVVSRSDRRGVGAGDSRFGVPPAGARLGAGGGCRDSHPCLPLPNHLNCVHPPLCCRVRKRAGVADRLHAQLWLHPLVELSVSLSCARSLSRSLSSRACWRARRHEWLLDERACSRAERAC